MSIWFQEITPHVLNQRGKHTLASFSGLNLLRLERRHLQRQCLRMSEPNSLWGSFMEVQMLFFAETFASTGANAVIDIEKS